MLIDVWRNIGSEARYLTHDTFSDAPSAPGVYAWYYPLKIASTNLEAFVADVNAAMAYNAATGGDTPFPLSVRMNWSVLEGSVRVAARSLSLADDLVDVWRQVIADPALFASFRENLLRCTILMPPLYVGKTKDLLRRLGEHVEGRDGKNDFHKRFTRYSTDCCLVNRSVSDLLFVCVPTRESSVTSGTAKIANLTEEIIKLIARPPYSER